MTRSASMMSPARSVYRGTITDPDRWAVWMPRVGDILVCTPPKCGTTWTQAILASLVHGGPDLPEKLGVLSPWVDADLGVPVEEVTAALAQQKGRRVVKTHTPADGFPVWDGVTVIAVYRHPLDAFFSLRKHIANRATIGPDHPMAGPLPDAFSSYLHGTVDTQDFERDSLAALVLHYTRATQGDCPPNLTLFHYADMLRAPRQAIAEMAEAIGIAPDPALIEAVTAATAIGTMRAQAAQYTPVAGTGFWKSDAGFFDAGRSGGWEDELSSEQIAQYEVRLAELLPDTKARQWLESGAQSARQA